MCTTFTIKQTATSVARRSFCASPGRPWHATFAVGLTIKHSPAQKRIMTGLILILSLGEEKRPNRSIEKNFNSINHYGSMIYKTQNEGVVRRNLPWHKWC